MKKIKYILWAATLAITLMWVQKSYAQSETAINTPASVEMTKQMALWFQTQNAAGLAIDQMHNYNEASLFYSLTNGDYKRCADGEKERLYGFNTNGALHLGQIYLWGDFSYKDEFLKNTLFNTNQIEVRRDMPFYVADPNLSDWMRRTYDLKMKVATNQLFNLFNVGLNIDYKNRVGAKQVDPRVHNLFTYDINVKPSILFTFAERHHLGLTGIYYNFKGNSTTVLSNIQVNPRVYLLKGLGHNYTANVGGSNSLNPYISRGDQLGGELQYSFNTSKIDVMLSAGYSKKVEDLIQDPSRPQMEGTAITTNKNMALQLLYKGGFLHKFSAEYEDNQTDGAEYVQELDRTYEVQKWFTKYKSIRSSYSDKDIYVAYDVMASAGIDYNWKVGVFFNYHKLSDIYYIPRSTMDWKSTMFGLQAKYNIHTGDYSRLLIGVNGALKSVSDDAGYIYGGPNPDSPVITDFFEKDFAIATNNNTKLGGEITFSTPISKSKYTSLYIKAVCDYYKASKIDLSRTYTHFSLGIIF